MFDEKINEIREGLKPGMIKKVNIKDPRILIFRRFDYKELENYYYPINKNALIYLKLKYKQYKKDQLRTIEYTIFGVIPNCKAISLGVFPFLYRKSIRFDLFTAIYVLDLFR